MKELNNSIYSAASLGFKSDFLSFVDVGLIRFFHGALQLLLLHLSKLQKSELFLCWDGPVVTAVTTSIVQT